MSHVLLKNTLSIYQNRSQESDAYVYHMLCCPNNIKFHCRYVTIFVPMLVCDHPIMRHLWALTCRTRRLQKHCVFKPRRALSLEGTWSRKLNFIHFPTFPNYCFFQHVFRKHQNCQRRYNSMISIRPGTCVLQHVRNIFRKLNSCELS